MSKKLKIGRSYAAFGAFALIVLVSLTAGVVLVQGQGNDSNLEGNEVSYRFLDDTSSPVELAEKLGIFQPQLEFSKRGNILDGESQSYFEYVIDAGTNCDTKLTEKEIAVLRTEFAQSFGWGQYDGEFLGPNCAGEGRRNATSTPENLFFPVIDDGGCRGYLTAEINPSGLVQTLEYSRFCPGGDLE